MELSCNSLQPYILLPHEAVPPPLVDRLEFVCQVHHLLTHPHRMLEDRPVTQRVRREGGRMGEGLLWPAGGTRRKAILLESQPTRQGMRILATRPGTQHLFLLVVFGLVDA